MNIEEDGTRSYSLNSYPSHSEHFCIRNGFENYRECGVMKMYQLVQENPHLEVPQIYNSVRQELSELFQGGARGAFLAQFPPYAYTNVQQKLYKERRCFTPAAPKTAVDFNIGLEQFIYDKETKENMVKGDIVLDNEWKANPVLFK